MSDGAKRVKTHAHRPCPLRLPCDCWQPELPVSAESRLRTRVLLEFGRLIPPHLEGPAVSLASDFYALGFRDESAGPYDVDVLADQYYDARRKLRANIYMPVPAEPPLPAVMLIHGGGWKYFSKTAVAGYGRLLASHGLVAVAVDYRLLEKPAGPPNWRI